MEHDHSAVIEERLAALGLTLSFGSHVDERDERDSASVAHRVADLHDAFTDPDVHGILTVIGGYNSNELLPHLNWELIRANPKVFCGYSDITALQLAMLARTGLLTFSGPHWSSFGMRDHFEQTGEWFRAAVFTADPVIIAPARHWTDDPWFLDQDHREVLPSTSWWPMRTGRAAGRLVGGNLSTLNLLPGTPYMPSLAHAVLVIEDDEESGIDAFARNLASLLQQPEVSTLRGLVVGRFQRASGIDRDALERILAVQPMLESVPILANFDFGHTSPSATLPIGGWISFSSDTDSPFVTVAAREIRDW